MDNEMCFRILWELVELKLLKESQGAVPLYESRKELVWDRAKKFVLENIDQYAKPKELVYPSEYYMRKHNIKASGNETY